MGLSLSFSLWRGHFWQIMTFWLAFIYLRGCFEVQVIQYPKMLALGFNVGCRVCSFLIEEEQWLEFSQLQWIPKVTRFHGGKNNQNISTNLSNPKDPYYLQHYSSIAFHTYLFHTLHVLP